MCPPHFLFGSDGVEGKKKKGSIPLLKCIIVSLSIKVNIII